MTGFRCSAASRDRSEPMAGSASTVRAFLLVEAPGPWGVDAISGARLDPEVRSRLRDLTRRGVRPLMVRAHGRQRGSGTRIFAASVARQPPWLETAHLAEPRELLDLPLDGLAAGSSAGLTRYDEPLFCVCTHGRHDACCAELGRPLCRAMHAVAPDHTWEISHIGGDRFAPNVLVLPHGLYYGRLDPAGAEEFVSTVRRGELDLGHLRGRSSLPFPVQAAEVFLRQHLAHLDATVLPVDARTVAGEETLVVFVVGSAHWQVRVRTRPGEPWQLTCRAASHSLAPRHDLLDIEAV